MLILLTWPEYGILISIAFIVYYTVLITLYYKNEILLLFKKGQQQKNNLVSNNDDLDQDKERSASFPNEIEDSSLEEVSLIKEVEMESTSDRFNQPELFSSHLKYTPLTQQTDETFQQVEELTAGLEEAIAIAVNKEYNKEEFILSLQLLLKKYYFLKGSLFQETINNLIISECEKYGSIHLSAVELVLLWKEVA